MKVLFAVNNESISETIIKKYQKIYGELLEYKNVYYYNAIVKEIQKEKDYNMIVISEDLETISSVDKSKADVFILDKLEKIIDVFNVEEINPIPILFISNEKRVIKDEIIPNMFNFGIYDALVGKDRTITKICELINSPRSEKQAREYYGLGTIASPGVEKEIVNLKEINNILRHYKKIISTPDRFSASFDRIVAQYDDIQLKYIIDRLPVEVKKVLEQENSKYKEVLNLKKEDIKLKAPIVTEPVIEEKQKIVIPQEINRNKEVQGIKLAPKPEIEEKIEEPVEETFIPGIEDNTTKEEPIIEKKFDKITVPEIEEEKLEEIVIEGNDDDIDIFPEETADDDFIPIFGDVEIEGLEETEEKDEDIKIDLDLKSEDVSLEVSQLDKDDINIFGDELLDSDNFIPTFEDETTEESEPEEVILDNDPIITMPEEEPKINIFDEPAEKIETKEIVTQSKKDFVVPDLSAVLSRDKKIVIFVGTSKNGTSFLVNSLGMMFASIGINTAILDMTKNRNSYYLSTKNDERLRQIAVDSISKLREGIAMGVEVVRGLTIYTALPGYKDNFADSDKILSTLAKNYSLVLIDADFDTNFGYFATAQEIYLVQSLDVLTIQPLTAFLKELLDAGVLTTEKTKVILNKEVAVRGLTRKILVGGVSTYNDPAMSIMTNLFDRNQVQVCSIPFDQNVYSKYLENIVECKFDISGYPKKFVEALKVLANMVYPLISKQRDVSLGGGSSQMTPPPTSTGPFSNDMSSTLDQMRRRL